MTSASAFPTNVYPKLPEKPMAPAGASKYSAPEVNDRQWQVVEDGLENWPQLEPSFFAALISAGPIAPAKYPSFHVLSATSLAARLALPIPNPAAIPSAGGGGAAQAMPFAVPTNVVPPVQLEQSSQAASSSTATDSPAGPIFDSAKEEQAPEGRYERIRAPVLARKKEESDRSFLGWLSNGLAYFTSPAPKPAAILAAGGGVAASATGTPTTNNSALSEPQTQAAQTASPAAPAATDLPEDQIADWAQTSWFAGTPTVTDKF